MKKNEIKIGVEYAVGRSNTYDRDRSRVRVLALDVPNSDRLYGKRYVGTKVVYLDKDGEVVQVDKVRLEGGYGRNSGVLVDYIRVLPNREIREEWTAYRLRKESERKAARNARAHTERVESANTDLARTVAKLLDERGVARPFGSGLTDRELGLVGYYEGDDPSVSHEIRGGRLKVDLSWLAGALGVPGMEPEPDDEED